MNMVLIIRHEVGKAAVSRMFFAVCLLSVLYMVAMAAILHLSPGATALWGAGALVLLTLLIYLFGYFDHKVVVHYVKKVAEEQRKVQAGCAKYLKELNGTLALLDRDPWQVYKRIMQRSENEIQEKHDASAGNSGLDYQLSRSMREVREKLELMHKAKKHNMTISPEEVSELKESFRAAIQWNEEYAAGSKKTLDEAEAFLSTLS